MRTRSDFPLLLVLSLLFASFLLTGCAPKIRGWSQEAFRTPDFKNGALAGQKLALFPVIVLQAPAGKVAPESAIPSAPYTPSSTGISLDQQGGQPQEVHRVILNEMLLSSFYNRYSAIEVMTPGQVLKALNDSGLTENYQEFLHDFNRIGQNGILIKKFGAALGCRYLFLSQAVVTEYKTDASYTIVWTFARKSILNVVKISAQIWDCQTEKQIWEGSGVGYNHLAPYEGAPLMENMAGKAVESLLGAITPLRDM